MNRSATIMGFVVLFAVAMGAADFTSEDAREAKRKYSKTVNDARMAYVSSLEKALEQAARAKNTDEITRIAAEISRIKDLSGEDQAFGSSGAFSKPELDDVTVRFMHTGGSELIQLRKDGAILPPQPSEYFWRVVDGELEFLAKDAKTPTTKWHRTFDCDGYSYACAWFLPDSSLPNVLAFEKPKLK